MSEPDSDNTTTSDDTSPEISDDDKSSININTIITEPRILDDNLIIILRLALLFGFFYISYNWFLIETLMKAAYHDFRVIRSLSRDWENFKYTLNIQVKRLTMGNIGEFTVVFRAIVLVVVFSLASIFTIILNKIVVGNVFSITYNLRARNTGDSTEDGESGDNDNGKSQNIDSSNNTVTNNNSSIPSLVKEVHKLPSTLCLIHVIIGALILLPSIFKELFAHSMQSRWQRLNRMYMTKGRQLYLKQEKQYYQNNLTWSPLINRFIAKHIISSKFDYDILAWCIRSIGWVAQIVTSMMAFQYLSIPTILVCRNCVPLVSALIEPMFIYRYKIGIEQFLCLSLVFIGTVVYWIGEKQTVDEYIKQSESETGQDQGQDQNQDQNQEQQPQDQESEFKLGILSLNFSSCQQNRNLILGLYWVMINSVTNVIMSIYERSFWIRRFRPTREVQLMLLLENKDKNIRQESQSRIMEEQQSFSIEFMSFLHNSIAIPIISMVCWVSGETEKWGIILATIVEKMTPPNQENNSVGQCSECQQQSESSESENGTNNDNDSDTGDANFSSSFLSFISLVATSAKDFYTGRNSKLIDAQVTPDYSLLDAENNDITTVEELISSSGPSFEFSWDNVELLIRSLEFLVIFVSALFGMGVGISAILLQKSISATSYLVFQNALRFVTLYIATFCSMFHLTGSEYEGQSVSGLQQYNLLSMIGCYVSFWGCLFYGLFTVKNNSNNDSSNKLNANGNKPFKNVEDLSTLDDYIRHSRQQWRSMTPSQRKRQMVLASMERRRRRVQEMKALSNNDSQQQYSPNRNGNFSDKQASAYQKRVLAAENAILNRRRLDSMFGYEPMDKEKEKKLLKDLIDKGLNELVDDSNGNGTNSDSKKPGDGGETDALSDSDQQKEIAAKEMKLLDDIIGNAPKPPEERRVVFRDSTTAFDHIYGSGGDSGSGNGKEAEPDSQPKSWDRSWKSDKKIRREKKKEMKIQKAKQQQLKAQRYENEWKKLNCGTKSSSSKSLSQKLKSKAKKGTKRNGGPLLNGLDSSEVLTAADFYDEEEDVNDNNTSSSFTSDSFFDTTDSDEDSDWDWDIEDENWVEGGGLWDSGIFDDDDSDEDDDDANGDDDDDFLYGNDTDDEEALAELAHLSNARNGQGGSGIELGNMVGNDSETEEGASSSSMADVSFAGQNGSTDSMRRRGRK